ncbi:hypothetical protein [Desulfosoma sp.]|uniref:hypothetical protein n=1 Tax=Desulfosoma sp. TaxID=2603217 RepID=UPI00404A4DC4
MRSALQRLSAVFAGGCLGALVNSWLAWYASQAGVPQKLDVAMAPVWSKAFVYPRIVWGGLWGFLFLLPLLRGGFLVGVFSRGILWSLGPTAAQLLYFYPFVFHKGWLGLGLGSLTPLFVFAYNAVWGLCAAWWIWTAEK